MDFPRWSQVRGKLQSQARPDAVAVSRRASQADPKSRLRRKVMKQPCGSAVLRDNKIGAAIPVVIGHRRSALLSIDFDPRLLSGHSFELPCAVAPQQEPATRIKPGRVGSSGKKVLTEKNIFMAVAIEIGYVHPESGGQLGFQWQRH